MRPELTEALEERLRNAPDPDAVLGRIRAGIAWRDRRLRRLRATGAITAVVLAAGASAVIVDRLRDPEPRPPAVQRDEAVEAPTTVQLGWVPDGFGRPVIRSTKATELIIYGDVNANTLIVKVDNIEWTPTADLPSWRRVEINGRPGRVLSIEGRDTELLFQLPSGRWVTVNRYDVDRDVGDSGAIERDAIRVAESLRELEGPPLRAAFTPNYLPRDLRVIGVRADTAARPSLGVTVICANGSLRLKEVLTHHKWNGAYSAEMALVDEGLGVDISVEPGNPNLGLAQRIPDIQGRPAYRLGFHEVAVTNFHGGWLRVVLTSSDRPDLGPPAPELGLWDELVKIAEGVRWIG